MDNVISTIKWTAAALGGVAGVLVGERDGALLAIIIFMAIDYLTGIMVAIKHGKLNSEVGFVGLGKKAMILLVVVLGNVLDVYVIGNGAAMRTAVIAFYLANEGLSILENMGKFGVPYPPALKKVLAQLGEGEDENGTS